MEKHGYNFPESLGYHSSVVYNQKLYVVGGVSAVYESQKQKVFPQEKTYRSFRKIHFFDFQNGRWSCEESNGVFPPMGIENFSIALWEGKLFIFGGWTGSSHSNGMWSLDLANLEWREIAYPVDSIRPTPRAGHTLNLISQNSLLLFGGQGNRESEANEFSLNSLEESEKYSNDVYNNQSLIYDLITCKWREICSEKHAIRPPPRAYHSCCSSTDGRFLFLFGGRNCESGALNDIWSFSVSKHTWTAISVTTPTIPRYHHTCTMIDGQTISDSTMLVIGGWSKSGTLCKIPYSAYNIKSKTWSSEALVVQATFKCDDDVMEPRAGHSVVISDDAVIWILGGEINRDGYRCLTNDFIALSNSNGNCLL
uniref:Uncharacterized protein n=1 Tax=Clytia hemisphaerica TaxID=252671 RepID=A0A7M5VGE2_9CNID